MENKDYDITAFSTVEEKPGTVEEKVDEGNIENPEKVKKIAEFWVKFKKYLNVGLCVLAVIFAFIGKALYVAYVSGAKNPVYIASVWMDFIGLGFSIACSIMQCLQFIRNKKFEFSTQVYINLLSYLIILI